MRIGPANLVWLLCLGCPTVEEPPPVVDTEAPAVDTNDTVPPDPPEVVVDDGVSWSWTETVVCASPDARQQAVFDLLPAEGDWAVQAVKTNSGSLFVGGGVTMADFNDDGYLDVFLTALDERGQLFYGSDEGLIDRTDLLPALPVKTAGGTPVDIDADGDLDLFVAVFKGHDLMLRNDGEAGFVDVAAALGLAGSETSRSIVSSWADLDGDGDLDGFVAAYGRLGGADTEGVPLGDPSYVYTQHADGTFTDGVQHLGESHVLATSHAFLGAWSDVDRDGDQDLYVVNDFGWRKANVLMRNTDGELATDRTVGLDFGHESMGLGVGDVNGDETPDFLVAAWDHLGLMLSQGDQWFDQAAAVGLSLDVGRGQHTAWGAELADLDNDGDLDAAIALGFLPVSSNHDNPTEQPDALYLQTDGVFQDVAPEWGMDHPGRSRGFVVVDVDRNGWLDLVKRDLRGPTRIFLQRCGEGAWLEVEVRQPGTANPFGIGTRIRVVDGDQVWTRTIRAGGTSYASAGPPEAHLGLGDRQTVDRLEIVWPDGAVTGADDVDLNRRVRVVRETPE